MTRAAMGVSVRRSWQEPGPGSVLFGVASLAWPNLP
jgi:hypothetical protein